MRRLLPLVILLACAPSAAGHSLVRPTGTLVNYLSEDATSLNSLTVSTSGDRLLFRDPTVDGGMDTGSCEPGAVNARAEIIEARCPMPTAIRIDLREREDSAKVTAAVNATVLGGDGIDRLETGAGKDQLDGGTGDDRLTAGAGDDVLVGGLGADTFSAGAGDDDLRSRDGIADQVACGEGGDRVDADTLDTIDPDCETVSRTSMPPPPGGGGADDRTAPRVEAESSGRSRTITILAASSERGGLAVSGTLDTGDQTLPLRPVRKRVKIAGEGVELVVRLTAAQWRAARRGRRPKLRLSVVATDEAGNSKLHRLPVVRLRT